MIEQEFTQKTKGLIDGLKATCHEYGLGNSGNEFQIITQVFLYKFLNDKFGYEVKSLDKKLKDSDNWEEEIKKYSDEEYEMLLLKMSPDSAKLTPDHFISTLFNRQKDDDYIKLFSDTLRDISKRNKDIFSVKTGEGTKIQLFNGIDDYVTNFSDKKKNDFATALINKLVDINFEEIFEQKFDFFSNIFEYMIQDYNTDGGGVYAEYYTPNAISRIMANILVEDGVKNATVYDPAAGSGTLLMNVAHKIGEDKCTIYSQDQSDKSSNLLRLNLILNNLVHSINNVIQGNTIKDPYFKNGNTLQKFDFSDWREDIDTRENSDRFFAGIPKEPPKDKKKMAIYLLFIQHIIYSLSDKGKAAIVVPTGFITAQNGIEKKIREKLIDEKMLRGAISMPSNIFATTGTNVSVIFIDRENKDGKIVLADASKLGTMIKEDGKNQKTVLSPEEEKQIVDIFKDKKEVEDLSVVVDYEEIAEKNYSFSAGQYFEIKIEYTDISKEDFEEKMKTFENNLDKYFKESKELEKEIKDNFNKLGYEN